MPNYNSPPRRSVAEPLLDPYEHEANTHSPTSTTSFDVIEAESYRLALDKSLEFDQKKLAREVLRNKADSFALQAKLLREESLATEVVSHLEKSLQNACDKAIECRMAMAELQEAEEIRYIKFEVKILNLKIWEDLRKDPDCKEIYAQKMEPRVRPFGEFSHLAFAVTEWVKLRQKLEWIEKVLVKSKFDELDPIENMHVMKKVLAKKADAIHKYNVLNDIIFFEKDEDN